MKRMGRLVGLDLDDVLIDFNSGLCIFHNARYGTSLTREDITSYYLEDIWKCDRVECERRIEEFYLSPEHEAMRPVPGAVEAVRQLQENGRDVVIVTSRPERASAPTRLLLEEHFPVLVDSVYFASHFFRGEAKKTKGEICKDLGAKAFVDDAPFHIEEVAGVVEHALLFKAPWNKNYKLSLPNVQEVKSWGKILQILK